MARHRGQKWGARDLGMPGLKTWQREALKRIVAKRGQAYVDALLRQRTNPRRSGHIGMSDLDLIAQDRATGVMLARYGQKYVVAEPVRAGTSFHGWMPRDQAKALYRQLTMKRSNPSKAQRLASKRKHRGDRIARRVVNDVLSEEWPHSLPRRLRRVRARYVRRGGDIFRFTNRHRHHRNPGLSGGHTLAGFAAAVVQALAWQSKTPRIPKDAMPMVRSAWQSGGDPGMVAEDIAAGRRRGYGRNPPRDPVYQGAFTIGHEPKRTGPYVDGDSAIVQTPYRAAKGVEAPWEVWIFGTVDPALGDRWNYVAGPMGKSDAIEAAKKLVRF